MAVTIFNKRTRKHVTLLNPSEKSRKYSAELKAGVHATNNGKLKKNKKGNAIRLSDTQKAYRFGYLAARKDNAKCFNSKRNKTGRGLIIYQG